MENVPFEIPGNKSQCVDASTRRHNAHLAGMKQVTPQSIAYIAVQVCALTWVKALLIIHLVTLCTLELRRLETGR
jgi:hypothetical protein